MAHLQWIPCRFVALLGIALAFHAGLASGAAPVGICDDATFLRRISQDLVGRQPSPLEIDAFLADASPTKRAAAIHRLLADPEWASTWARYFRDVILYRRTDDRAAFMAKPLETFLADRLHADQPWSHIACQMITATGAASEHGETAIIMAQMGETSDIAAEVSRIFMGIQIQCAQCHDHFTDRWKRQQFHQFAAFFPRVEIDRSPGQGADGYTVVSRDHDPRRSKKKPDNPRRGDLEHTMPDLNDPSQPGTVMQPLFFLTGQSLPLGTSDMDRRQAIAKWITARDNPWFARAMINRLWAELVGDGFYRGVDDMGPDRTAQSPEILDELSQAFADSGHDVRATFRAIMASNEYQHASRSRVSHEREGFAANCPQRLRSDQLFTQILAAVGVDESQVGNSGPGKSEKKQQSKKPRDTHAGRRQLNVPRAMFTQVFGYDPSLPREEIVGSIPQALLLMNSQPLSTAIDGDRRFTALGQLLAANKSNRDVAEKLYLRTLARSPTADEMKTCLDHVRLSVSREEGFEDVFWALLNSAEFVYRK